VAETLVDLALDDDEHERLRETVRVFLTTGGSYVASAERLHPHRNSAHYRIRKAEQMQPKRLPGGSRAPPPKNSPLAAPNPPCHPERSAKGAKSKDSHNAN
jgi:hypothetical protein